MSIFLCFFYLYIYFFAFSFSTVVLLCFFLFINFVFFVFTFYVFKCYAFMFFFIVLCICSFPSSLALSTSSIFPIFRFQVYNISAPVSHYQTIVYIWSICCIFLFFYQVASLYILFMSSFFLSSCTFSHIFFIIFHSFHIFHYFSYNNFQNNTMFFCYTSLTIT